MSNSLCPEVIGLIVLITMSVRKIFLASALMLASFGAFAQENTAKIKWYGFIRNYFAYDSRESKSGTEDLFTYLPLDQKMVGGDDLNAISSFRFAALTSRLGVDVSGYEYEGWKMGAKIEADFYSGVSGVTGTAQMRMRQAYLTLAKDKTNLKIGQAWHPMAADMPDVISLNAGAPFGPFSRTPMVNLDYKLADGLSLNAVALWQMQYVSAGPAGQVANYIKYGKTPELFLGLNYKSEGFTAKAGVDMLSIKPRNFDASGTKRVDDRITTMSTFLYAQYVEGNFAVKAKTAFAEAGEHMNLNGGYGVSAINADGSWEYTPTLNSSSWISFKYGGKKLQGVFFAGYVKNLGTKGDLLSPSELYFSKNSFSNMNQMWRMTPTLIYNLGKFSLALEYEVTSVQYGTWGTDFKKGLATNDLRWVTNNRLQLMTRYTF